MLLLHSILLPEVGTEFGMVITAMFGHINIVGLKIKTSACKNNQAAS
jgi:hypothetical protein